MLVYFFLKLTVSFLSNMGDNNHGRLPSSPSFTALRENRDFLDNLEGDLNIKYQISTLSSNLQSPFINYRIEIKYDFPPQHVG